MPARLCSVVARRDVSTTTNLSDATRRRPSSKRKFEYDYDTSGLRGSHIVNCIGWMVTRYELRGSSTGVEGTATCEIYSEYCILPLSTYYSLFSRTVTLQSRWYQRPRSFPNSAHQQLVQRAEGSLRPMKSAVNDVHARREFFQNCRYCYAPQATSSPLTSIRSSSNEEAGTRFSTRVCALRKWLTGATRNKNQLTRMVCRNGRTRMPNFWGSCPFTACFDG